MTTATMTVGARTVRDYVQRGHVEKTLQAMPTATRKLRVAAYARVSTDDDEQLNSYKTQCEYYTDYIKSKPEWEYVDLYADEGFTGTCVKKRKEFQRLIRDALAGKIDLILVKSVSRFARNTVDSLQTVRDLRDRGIKIFFEKENIDSLDPKCDMILSIYSSLAEEESRSISTNIRWAHQKKRDRGEVILNFNNIYGYQQDKEKNITVKEDEAEDVRDIYFKFLIGYSFKAIADDLQERGIKTPLGGDRWHMSTVKTMLENEKYQGDCILQKTYKRDILQPYAVKNTGQAPQKYIENNHPAIVDRTTWNAVQAELERRGGLRSTEKTGKGRYEWRYAFSGIIQCGDCGSAFRRHNYTHGDKVDAVWVCKEHIKSNTLCGQLPIRESYLEALFVKTFNGLLFDRDRAATAVKESVAEAMLEAGEDTGAADEIAAVDGEIESLQAKMLELNKQRARREIDGEAYNVETKAVTDAIDGLFTKRDDLTEQQGAGALSAARQKILAEFLESVEHQTEFDKDVFTKLVERITVKTRGDITFEFKDGTSVKAYTGGEQ